MTLSMGLCMPRSEPGVHFQGHPSCPSGTLLAELYIKAISTCNSALCYPSSRNAFWIIYLETSWLFLVPLGCDSLGYFSCPPDFFCSSRPDLSLARVLSPSPPGELQRSWVSAQKPYNCSSEVPGEQETCVGTLESGLQWQGTSMASWYLRKGFGRVFPDVIAEPSGIPLLFSMKESCTSWLMLRFRPFLI